ncbi:sodium:solute symporter family protein [Synergistes jonesii]|uniref:sodium:solute symporter family protein n=1 Tax=Synergistes jonesii TaxID=2754 RepID=UPI0033268C47
MENTYLLGAHRGIVLITIIAYFTLTLFIGYIGRAGKASHDDAELKDWAVAGRNIGAIVLGLAWSATYFSSYAVLGVAGQAYTEGLSVMNLATAYFVPTAALMYIFGAGINILGRTNNYMSVGDLLEDRYGTKYARLPIIITTLIFSGYFTGIQLIGAALVLEQLAGIPYFIALILGAAVLCIYVMMGGFKSTALTDTLQATLLFIALFGGGIIAIKITGGKLFSMLIEKVGVAGITSPGLKGLATPVFGISYSINIILYCFGYMFFQWMLAAENPQALRKAAGIYSVVCPAGYIFGSILLGVAGLAIGLKAARPDYIFPVVIVEFFGPVMASVLIAGVLGATQSTAASVLAGVSLCSSYDLYKKMINPNASEKKVVVISRTMSVLVLVGSIILAMTAREGIMLLGAIGISFFSVTAPSVLASVFWPRATKQAAIAAPFIGLVVLCYTVFVQKNMLGIHPGLWGACTSMIALIIISYITPKTEEERIDRICGTISAVYNKKLHSLWFPTKPGNAVATFLLVAQMFAICYGLKYIRSTTLILGMAPQYAWVVFWWAVSLICMWYIFNHTPIDTTVKK